MTIVSNTSPIGNLAIVGEISLLQQVYPRVFIPNAVYAELNCMPILRPTISVLLTSGWLRIRKPTNAHLVGLLKQTLDPGESEAIALAIELGADRLLIDERLGRLIAESYGLKPRGLLGVLIQAKRQNRLSDLKPLLDRLIQEAGFRVSQELYVRTLQAVGE